jgi:hypothetical protein
MRRIAMRKQNFFRIAGPLAVAVLVSAQAPETPTEDVVITAPSEWRVLRTEKVRGPRDEGSALGDTGPKHAERIAFLPLDGDVQCDRISVSFEDGHSTWLQLGNGPVFTEGSLYAFDLREARGDRQNELTRINFTCLTVANTTVTMQILGSG